MHLHTPLLNTDVTYFVDGSCYQDHLGNHAGFAVVKKEGEHFTTVKADSCTQPCSGQLAELKGLTKACMLANYNIYKDSAYAHGVCHLFGAKKKSTPIQHVEQITPGISTMNLPTKLAIIKCQSHKKGNNRSSDETMQRRRQQNLHLKAKLQSWHH